MERILSSSRDWFLQSSEQTLPFRLGEITDRVFFRDRVMETLQQTKTLPPDMASQRRGNVNLFMQAIGLDVDLLDG